MCLVSFARGGGGVNWAPMVTFFLFQSSFTNQASELVHLRPCLILTLGLSLFQGKSISSASRAPTLLFLIAPANLG
jgi:hypothetical protein